MLKTTSGTKVVNVKVLYIRPKYNNLKEWCNDDENVYIGRRGVVFIDGVRYPPQDSLWANPYKIGTEPRDVVLKKYEKRLRNMLKKPDILEKFLLLKGKNLGCWCKSDKMDVSCHGDIIVKILNEYEY